MSEINPLTDKVTLTVRLREAKEDYDTVRGEMEDKLGLTGVQWASIHLLCDMYASFYLARIDSERAGFDPDDLLG